MAKRLLLISNSTNYGEKYLEYTKPNIKKFLGEAVKEVLFVPYAGVVMTYDEYTQKVAAVFNELGYDVRSVHQYDDPVEAVNKAEAIVVGGGNTFHLVHKLHETGLMTAIREKAENGTPYIGWSAGSNVACPTLKTTNDMPIVEPESFDAMGLIPFQINPHYTDAIIPNHNGESREDRIREFLVANPNMMVVGLKEGAMLQIKDQDIKYIGSKTIKVFKKDKPTLEYDKNAALDFLR
ncbi:MAG: dipeptidase PepE [Bacteroidales bacterium]